jgi:hypothetical protein
MTKLETAKLDKMKKKEAMDFARYLMWEMYRIRLHPGFYYREFKQSGKLKREESQ